jgi:hypothetical protein
LYQSLKDFRGVLVLIDGALGMPLDCQDKVIGSCSFERLDDAIVGTARYDPQTFANLVG